MKHEMRLNTHRTSVDEIFEHVRDEILSLRLRPGDKISEAEIAAQFDVSRQPARDAFSRLSNQDLVVIRPQQATEVKRFSRREIMKSRFLRASVEKEVARRAAECCDAKGAAILDAVMEVQERAIDEKNIDGFGALDYKFHKALCEVAQVEFAFDIIESAKSKVDRLCLLAPPIDERMPALVADHRDIAQAIKSRNPDRAAELMMHHLSRLDKTIERIYETNADCFDQVDL